MFIVLLLALAAMGLLVSFYLGTPTHTASLAVALAVSAIAALIPWHRVHQDAFAAYCVFVIGWIGWWVAITGGAQSPHLALTLLAVVMCAVSLSRWVGAVLAIVAAASTSLPLAYQAPASVPFQEPITRMVVLIIVALATVWLAHEVRRAVDVATIARTRLRSEQEVSSELRRAQDQRSEYLSVLAHELRNPLNGINAAARVLAKEVQGEKAEGTARAIANEARHAMELLDGLTDVASLESGRMRLALRPIDLAAVVQEIANTTVEEHRVVLRGGTEPLIVLGDDRRLAQVIRNLVSNAAKYSPPGSEIHVSLGMSADRRNAIVQVRDEGPGIPPSERGRLFERFQRLSTAGGTRGSGLGLYISRGIVNDHGGEMWADWPAGGGSVFSFSMPLSSGGRASER